MSYLIPETLETPRLKLRMFKLEDWQSLCEVFGDEVGVKYTLKTPLPDWQTWRWLAAYAGHWQLRGYGPYAVEEKKSGKMIGPIGLYYPGEWPEPELTYSIACAHWGNGYVTEAGAAVKAMAKATLGWNRLVSLIRPENHRSIAVAKRLGATFEKTIPFRDETADIFVYSLAASAGVP